MSKHNDNYSIIVAVADANLTAHTYTEIYGGSAGCTMTLNGVAVSIGASSSIQVSVRTVSGGAGCYLLGEKIDVTQGSPRLGNNFGPTLY